MSLRMLALWPDALGFHADAPAAAVQPERCVTDVKSGCPSCADLFNSATTQTCAPVSGLQDALVDTRAFCSGFKEVDGDMRTPCKFDPEGKCVADTACQVKCCPPTADQEPVFRRLRRDKSNEDSFEEVRIEQFSQVSWHLSSEGRSCDDKCAWLNATCNLKALMATNSPAAIVNAAKDAGVDCVSDKGPTVSWGYKSNPAICTSAKCCGDGSCMGVCAYGSHAEISCATTGGHYSRLCACNKKQPEEQECWNAPGTLYVDGDIAFGYTKNVQSAAECQYMCQQMQECKVFLYSSDRKTCERKCAVGEKCPGLVRGPTVQTTKFIAGVITGPRECPAAPSEGNGVSTCSRGVASTVRDGGQVCCHAKCGGCAGKDCSRRPGGTGNCCRSHILKKGRVCSKPDDVACAISGAFVRPGKGAQLG